MDDSITYEQPLNEQMRICLRLEHLFDQFNHHVENPAIASSRIAISALLKTLNVIDRPDLKSKLTQTLTQQAAALAQLERAKNVDPNKLSAILTKLESLAATLHGTHDKVGQRLRSNAFLSQVRAQLNNPAGVSNFSSPAFALWLKQSSDARTGDLKVWAKEFESLETIVKTILYLTRDSSPAQSHVAHSGFYQQSLDPAVPCQMIRVTLPVEKTAYPEISVGKHRIMIRFLEPDFLGHQARQISESLTFSLSCCRV